MAGSLLDRLLAEEFTKRDRAMFLDAFAKESTGTHRFNFNVFNVFVDFDSHTVTIEDVLELDSAMTLSIDDFAEHLRKRTPS